ERERGDGGAGDEHGYAGRVAVHGGEAAGAVAAARHREYDARDAEQEVEQRAEHRGDRANSDRVARGRAPGGSDQLERRVAGARGGGEAGSAGGADGDRGHGEVERERDEERDHD